MILQKKNEAYLNHTGQVERCQTLSCWLAAAASSLNHVSATSKALALVMGDSQ